MGKTIKEWWSIFNERDWGDGWVVVYNPSMNHLSLCHSALELYWRLEFGGWHLIGEL